MRQVTRHRSHDREYSPTVTRRTMSRLVRDSTRALDRRGEASTNANLPAGHGAVVGEQVMPRQQQRFQPMTAGSLRE